MSKLYHAPVRSGRYQGRCHSIYLSSQGRCDGLSSKFSPGLLLPPYMRGRYCILSSLLHKQFFVAEQPNNWTLSLEPYIEKSGQPPFRNNSLLDPMAVVLFAFYSHRLDWPNYIPMGIGQLYFMMHVIGWSFRLSISDALLSCLVSYSYLHLKDSVLDVRTYKIQSTNISLCCD